MKKIFFILINIIIILFFAFKPVDDILNLDQALEKKLVKYSIQVNPESTHYIKPVSITIHNIDSVPLKVRVPNGLQFVSDLSEYQNLIITQEEILALEPQKSLTIPLYGMCTEKADKAPTTETTYKIGKQADQKVTKLTQYIQKQKLHNPLGQSAVWAMTCDAPLEDIVGFDTSSVRYLVKFVSIALKKPMPPPPAPDDTKRNYYATNYKATLSGSFNYNFNKIRSVSIAMFNKDNIVVRELYRNPKEPPGNHKIEYKFDSTEYTDEFYYLRLIADGEIVLNGKIDNRDDFNRN